MAQLKDIFPSYRFRLEFTGLQTAVFQKVSGLTGKVAVRKYEDGGDNAPTKYAGKFEPGDIDCELGATKSLELWQWFEASKRGTADKRSGALVVIDPATGIELERWNIIGAFPIEFTPGDWDATSQDANQMRKLKLAIDDFFPG